MVKILESKRGQKSITLRAGFCEAMGLKVGDRVVIEFRPDLGLWEFKKVIV